MQHAAATSSIMQSSAGVQPATGFYGLLPRELVERIASYLGPNDIAVLRQLDTATHALFASPQYACFHLSLPVPADLFARQWGAGVVRHLPLKQRRQLVTLTAASGVLQVNALDVLAR